MSEMRATTVERAGRRKNTTDTHRDRPSLPQAVHPPYRLLLQSQVEHLRRTQRIKDGGQHTIYRYIPVLLFSRRIHVVAIRNSLSLVWETLHYPQLSSRLRIVRNNWERRIQTQCGVSNTEATTPAKGINHASYNLREVFSLLFSAVLHSREPRGLAWQHGVS